MSNSRIYALALAGSVAFMTAMPAPWAAQCAAMARVAAIAVSRPDVKADALHVLELVSLGRTQEITSQEAAAVGARTADLRSTGFADATVRAFALRKLGETGLPEALEFLRGLKQGDFSTDNTQQIWPAAHIALHQAMLSQILDPHRRAEFLEGVISTQRTGATAAWAANELCDVGAVSAPPAIRNSFQANWSGQSGTREIGFCEQRVAVIQRDPDRVKALGSVLRNTGSEDDRMIRWAADQLTKLKTAASEAELDRFIDEAGRSSVDSAHHQLLLTLREEILSERRNRLK